MLKVRATSTLLRPISDIEIKQEKKLETEEEKLKAAEEELTEMRMVMKQQTTLFKDSSPSSHSLQLPVFDPQKIWLLFDDISYDKGKTGDFCFWTDSLRRIVLFYYLLLFCVRISRAL